MPKAIRSLGKIDFPQPLLEILCVVALAHHSANLPIPIQSTICYPAYNARMCVCMYVCICVYVCICMYVRIYMCTYDHV